MGAQASLPASSDGDELTGEQFENHGKIQFVSPDHLIGQPSSNVLTEQDGSTEKTEESLSVTNTRALENTISVTDDIKTVQGKTLEEITEKSMVAGNGGVTTVEVEVNGDTTTEVEVNGDTTTEIEVIGDTTTEVEVNGDTTTEVEGNADTVTKDISDKTAVEIEGDTVNTRELGDETDKDISAAIQGDSEDTSVIVEETENAGTAAEANTNTNNVGVETETENQDENICEKSITVDEHTANASIGDEKNNHSICKEVENKNGNNSEEVEKETANQSTIVEENMGTSENEDTENNAVAGDIGEESVAADEVKCEDANETIENTSTTVNTSEDIEGKTDNNISLVGAVTIEEGNANSSVMHSVSSEVQVRLLRFSSCNTSFREC